MSELINEIEIDPHPEFTFELISTFNYIS